MKEKRTRRRGIVLAVLAVGSLLAVAAGAGLVAADSPADPVRALPEDPVMPGDEFEVIVTFTSPHDDFHAIGLSDLAPEGWSVSVDTSWTSPQAMDAHTPAPNGVNYIWAGPYQAGTVFTAMYRVQVPSDADPGMYDFPGGSLEYYIQGFPAESYIEPSIGDEEVTITEKKTPVVPPVGGSAYPVDRLSLLAPWIALAAVITAGLVVFSRRRTVES